MEYLILSNSLFLATLNPTVDDISSGRRKTTHKITDNIEVMRIKELLCLKKILLNCS